MFTSSLLTAPAHVAEAAVSSHYVAATAALPLLSAAPPTTAPTQPLADVCYL